MKNNMISMHFMDYKTSYVLRDNAFKFSPAAGVRGWLQKKLWSLLESSGAIAPYHENVTTATRVGIDTRKAFDAIYKSRHYLALQDIRAKVVLIGAEDFAELMQDPAMNRIQTMVSFRQNHKEILGLEVRIIPHMRGVLVL